MIVATRNRAHTLKKVAPSFFAQEGVSEIIFVNDCGDDDTDSVLKDISNDYPHVHCNIIRNAQRMGQGQSRNIGIAAAKYDYLLFCDDDEYMEAGYAKTCLEKLNKYNAGVVSGRRIYMRVGETQEQALKRFGNGLRRIPPYYKTICEYANSAKFDGDAQIPLVNSIMLTKKETVLKFPFDSFYFQGNGYREESDFHMNLYVNGYKNYKTNDCHTFHLPLEEVKTGGQRVNLSKRIYWSNRYNSYFFDKYYNRYADIAGVDCPKDVAKILFFLFTIYKEIFRPFMRDVYVRAEEYFR